MGKAGSPENLEAEIESLRSQLEKYRSVADNSSDYIMRYDREYRHIYANQGAVLATGLSEEHQWINKTHRELGYPGDLCDRCEEAIRQVFETGEMNTTVEEADTVAGKAWLEAKWQPERDPRGEVVSVLCMSRDVTKRRQAEENLLKLQKLESLGVLAGGIAHDFNNILTGILGNLSLAGRETTPGSDLHEYIEEALKACSNARGLTQQLLTFAKGGLPILEVTAVDAVLREAATFATRGSPSKCTFEIDEDLPLAEIDAGQIAQVVQNLVINSAQAMPGGGLIRLDAKSVDLHDSEVPGLGSGQHLRLTVADGGAGISDEALPRLFDPYFSTKSTGRGLGLATCLSIVSKHGGYLGVAETSGSGTVFELYLPATANQVAVDQSPPVRCSEPGGRVLVMDDDRIVSKTLSLLLTILGYEPVSVPDGENALVAYQEAMHTSPFAVVILDLTVPGGMGGKATIEKLRVIDPGVRAIVSSGYSADPVMSDHLAHGFRGRLSKPYTTSELSQVLLAVLAEDSEVQVG